MSALDENCPKCHHTKTIHYIYGVCLATVPGGQCSCRLTSNDIDLAQLREDNKYLNSEIDRLDNLIEPLLHSDEEFAQLRAALAERDKTIAEARRLIEAVAQLDHWGIPAVEAKCKSIVWLSAHPTQESDEK